MAFDVPYVINGSKHSARLFRRQYQNASGEGSGVTRAGDLKVQPLNVPGDGFRVAPGGATVQSRDTFASARESYGPVNDQEIVVTGVPGTGSGETRRDLVILEVTDPQMESITYPEPSTEEGWQDGDNFCRITIIQDVDSLVPAAERPVRSLDQITTGAYANVTGYALAAITYPASTSTITSAMVEDLREVQTPRSRPVLRTYALVGGEEQVITSTSAYPAGQTWPVAVEDAWGETVIPEWATRARVVMMWTGVRFPAGNAWGNLWVQIGMTVDPNNVKTQTVQWDSPGATGNSAVTLVAADDISIPAGLRGTAQKFYPRANRTGGDSAASARLTAMSAMVLQIEFYSTAA